MIIHILHCKLYTLPSLTIHPQFITHLAAATTALLLSQHTLPSHSSPFVIHSDIHRKLHCLKNSVRLHKNVCSSSSIKCLPLILESRLWHFQCMLGCLVFTWFTKLWHGLQDLLYIHVIVGVSISHRTLMWTTGSLMCTCVCWCFHEPPNSDKDYRILNVYMWLLVFPWATKLWCGLQDL